MFVSYELLYEQALAMHERGNFDEAEGLYRQLLQVNPENPDILNLLGLIAQEKGVHSQAVDLFYKAIKLVPEHLPYKFNLALSLEHLGKDMEAIGYYNKVLIKESFNNIGRIYHKLGKIETARENFLAAVNMDSDYAEANANLAMTYYNDEAIDMLENIIDPLAFEYLAQIYIEEKNWDKALDYALRAGNDELIGAVYAFRGKHDKAKEYLMKVNTAPALINSANLATNEGNFDEAEKLYKQALEFGRSVYDAHLNYGRMLYLQGRTSEALEEYRKAVQANPYAPEASNNLGLILKDMKDFDEALGLFFNAYMVQPLVEEYAVNISETLILYARDNYDNAVKIAKNWVKNAEMDIFAINTLKILKNKEVDKLYTQKLFDHFAENYEKVLDKVNYKVVSEIKKILDNVEGTILDLGCGTGLVGKALKSEKNKIIGVDISAKMLEVAASSGVYEELLEVDILEYLNNKDFFTPQGRGVNLIVAADVFSYFKELKDIVKACKRVPLVFSIEAGVGCYNGRYKHNPCKIEKLLLRCGYNKIEKYPLILRIEDGQDVEGILFVAR